MVLCVCLVGIILGLPTLTEGVFEDPELQCQVSPLHVGVLEDVFDRRRTRKLRKTKSLSPPLLHPDSVYKIDLTLIFALAFVTYPNAVPLSWKGGLRSRQWAHWDSDAHAVWIPSFP